MTDHVPFRYGSLYSCLDAKLTDFEQCVFSHPVGRSDTLFGAELLSANGNRGLKLLEPAAQEWMYLELDRLQALGLGGVSIALNFPLLYEPFWAWTGEPQRYQEFVDLYAHLVENIENRHMRLVADNAVVFAGYYSEDAGFNVSDYYETLDREALIEGRAQMATTILEDLDPAYLNLGSEPDTQAEMVGDDSLNSPEGYGSFIREVLDRIPSSSRRNTPLGAGVGTWKLDGTEYIDALAAAGIDYIDLHVYPVNFQCLMDRLEELVNCADAHVLPVAIGEAWLLKQRDWECTTGSAATNPLIFSRDAFDFWKPLDQKFLCSLVQFARWKELAYFSGFWSRYFWGYLEYADCRGLSPDEITTRAANVAGLAMKAGLTTDTGKAYRDAISSQGDES